MQNEALNTEYKAAYAKLEALQNADENICSRFYAYFCDLAMRDYDENRALYA
jgi:hypothetical protein